MYPFNSIRFLDFERAQKQGGIVILVVLQFFLRYKRLNLEADYNPS